VTVFGSTEKWKVQTICENSSNYSPFVIDQNNTVHIAYTALINGTYYIKYASWNGSSFSIETVCTGSNVYNLVFDSKDTPHILYGTYIDNGYPQGTIHTLTIASWNGTEWSKQSTNADDTAYGTLALDSHDNPHIAFIAGNDLKYSSWTGTNWNTQEVDTIPEYPATESFKVSLVLDANDTPQILYSPSSSKYNQTGMWSLNVKLATYQNLSWNIQTLSLPAPTGDYGNLVLDKKGYPHFICTQNGFENTTLISTLLHVSWNGTTWITEALISDIQIRFGSSVHLVLDTQDFSNIVFTDFGESLFYGTSSNEGWNLKSIGPNIAANGQSYLAIDKKGNPHIIYSSEPSNRYTSTLRYATIDTEQNLPVTSDVNTIVIPVTIIGLIATITGIAYIWKRKSP
jgi:hypothetical protein